MELWDNFKWPNIWVIKDGVPKIGAQGSKMVCEEIMAKCFKLDENYKLTDSRSSTNLKHKSMKKRRHIIITLLQASNRIKSS